MKQQSATYNEAIDFPNNTDEEGYNPRYDMLEDGNGGLDYKSKVMITGTNTVGSVIYDGFWEGFLGNQIQPAKSAKSTDGKMYTGCTEKVYATASAAAQPLKGSTKTYTQGVYYEADDMEKKNGQKWGSMNQAEVTVIIAADLANNLMTSLGAVVVGVVALTF